ncbi:MAG: hypothetical protein IKP53_08565 [Candidatus Methanomethylophilaceae archaeon]|nr:hypothetical protein [Candidatus Methanomethylophilaceae archaeon]
MTRRKVPAARAKKVKKLILKRTPVNEIASLLKISPSSVRNAITALIVGKEIVRVPNTNPTLYTDPHARVFLTDAEEDEIVTNGPSVKINGPLLDALPDDARLPLGFVNRHLAGYISFKVRAKGSFDDIPDPMGGYCGYWDEPTSGGKGQTKWKADIRMFGQSIRVDYYESTHGVTQFRVYPGRVYIDPSKISLQQSSDYMVQRSIYIVSILRANGWQVTDPEIKGVWHTAKENDPLARLIPSDRNDESDDIIVDTSPGFPETEMEGDPDEELVKIYANMPSAIKAVGEAAEGACAKADGALAKADDALGKADRAIAIADGAMAATDRMMQELESFQQVLAAQSRAIEMLAGNVTALAEVQARFATMSMAQIQGQVRDAIKSFDGRGYA